MAKDTPGKIRGGARAASKLAKKELRAPSGAVKKLNKSLKEYVKRTGDKESAMKATSSGYRAANTNSARKQSMPVKGAKNKMKAQGMKANMTPSTTAAARSRQMRSK